MVRADGCQHAWIAAGLRADNRIPASVEQTELALLTKARSGGASMNEDDDKPRNARPFEPFLNPTEREELHGLLDFSGPTPPQFAASLRVLARSYIDDGD